MDVYARAVLGDVSAREVVTPQPASNLWWVAGPYVRLACERHLSDREREGSAGFSWQFNETAADAWIDFYEQVLKLPDTAGDDGMPKPFLLHPSQAFIIGSLFGWLGPDGNRRFREGYIEEGKGNGKTPLLAGMGNGELALGFELAPEVYSAAVTRDQARIMFRDADRMVDASPELRPLITKTVNNLACGLGFFRPFSRDQGVKSGPRPSMALIDEVHEHPTGEVINKLKAGFKFRKQPLAVMITNSGFDRTSICFQMHEHSIRVLRGLAQDERLFTYVCALDDGEDPLIDESCWVKTNPLLGVTITLDYLRRQVANAKSLPSETNIVLRLNFCVWTNQHTRAIDMAQWALCQAVISDDELIDLPCYAGLDLGMSDDLSAFVRTWPLDDGRLAIRARFWIPKASIEKFPNRPYDEWVKAGVLEVTEGGPTTDYATIQEAIEHDCLESGVRALAYDKRFAEQMAQYLAGRGINCVDTAQGFQLNEPTKRMLEMIAEVQLCCGGNPILSFMASNFVIRHGRNKEIRPDKDAASEKIDGIVALIMAIDQGVVRNEAPGRSTYDQDNAEVFTW